MLDEGQMRTHAPVRAPLWPAIAVAAAALIAGGTAVWCFAAEPTSELLTTVTIAGYVFGCIVAVALASAHRALENRVRSNPGFRLQPVLGTAVTVFVAVGIAGGLANAFLLATELAK